MSTDGLDQLRLLKAWVQMAVRWQPGTIHSSASRRVERFKSQVEQKLPCVCRELSFVVQQAITDLTSFPRLASGSLRNVFQEGYIARTVVMW